MSAAWSLGGYSCPGLAPVRVLPQGLTRQIEYRLLLPVSLRNLARRCCLTCTLCLTLGACKANPSYESGRANSGDFGQDAGGTEAGPTLNWMRQTFEGIYQVHSYYVDDRGCSATGDDRAYSISAYFWVHAFAGLDATVEMCTCGDSLEQCRTFIDQAGSGRPTVCSLQRTATERVSDSEAAHEWQYAGTSDGFQTCQQGGLETVSFERDGKLIRIGHRVTQLDYSTPDGQCSELRGASAAQGVPCTQRDTLEGTFVAAE